MITVMISTEMMNMKLLIKIKKQTAKPVINQSLNHHPDKRRETTFKKKKRVSMTNTKMDKFTNMSATLKLLKMSLHNNL